MIEAPIGDPNNSTNLDLLRSIAVSMVMIDHLIPTLVFTGVHVPTWLRAVTEYIGQAGVLSFFVHTTLVLMRSLARMSESSKRDSLTTRFYLRRFFRIYPLAFVCVVVVVVLQLPQTTWSPPLTLTPRIIFANLLLVQNLVSGESVIVPLWSLPYEVQMYLILPALYLLTRRKRALESVIGLTGAMMGLGVLVSRITGGRLNMFAYAPCFLCGVLAYVLRDRIRPRRSGGAWGPFVVSLVMAYCLIHVPEWSQSYRGPVYWIGWIYCVILALGVNFFENSRNEFVNRIASRVATYSYGLYLIHVPILHLVFNVWRPRSPVVGVVAFGVATFSCSALSYHFLEGPLVALGRRLSESDSFPIRRVTVSNFGPKARNDS